jgi:hypothetical protein
LRIFITPRYIDNADRHKVSNEYVKVISLFLILCECDTRTTARRDIMSESEEGQEMLTWDFSNKLVLDYPHGSLEVGFWQPSEEVAPWRLEALLINTFEYGELSQTIRGILEATLHGADSGLCEKFFVLSFALSEVPFRLLVKVSLPHFPSETSITALKNGLSSAIMSKLVNNAYQAVFDSSCFGRPLSKWYTNGSLLSTRKASRYFWANFAQ